MKKKTRGKEYFQYLVKLKGQRTDDSTLMTTTEVQKYHVDPEDMINNYFLPRESDAGAFEPNDHF
jgi:hypothetical protein